MKYDAFISYSHSDCGSIAPAVQNAIENIGKPWHKLGRNLNVFRDKTNLAANPDLWHKIENSLDESKTFILLASPETCKSEYIPLEIDKWIENDPTLDKIFIVKTAGNLEWNKNTNTDFDWKKTNCLPGNLKHKFSKQPIWIDLSKYTKKKDFKSQEFLLEVAIIVAGISGVEPRDIISDEKTRRRNTIFAVTIALISIFLLLIFGLMINQKNETNKRIAIANNLIAEANNYRETDINKALLKYADAYKVNPTPEIFKLLSDFYQQKTIDTLTVDSVKNTYFLNKFSSIVFDRKYIDKNEENDFVFGAIFPDHHTYSTYKNGEIIFYDLKSKLKIKKLKTSNCKNISADKSNILYETDKNDLIIYHLNTNKIDTVALAGKFKSNKEEITRNYNNYSNDKYIPAYINKSSIVIFKQIEPKKLKIIIGDCNRLEWSEYFLKNDAEGTETGMLFTLINSKIDRFNKIIHYSSQINYPNKYYKEEIRNLNYSDSILYAPRKSNRDNYSFSSQSHFIKDYYITGLYNGQIEVHKEMGWNNEEHRNAPKAIDLSKGLIDFVIYKDYLIAGYDTGKLNFYLLYGNSNDLKNDRLQYEEMPLLKSMSLPIGQEIFQLILHNEILYIITLNGSLVKIPLKLKINLDRNPEKLLKQLNQLIVNN